MSSIRYNPERAHKRINKALNHLTFLSHHGIDLRGRTVLETGTGANGVDIILFAIAGTRRIFTFDVMPQLSLDKLRITAHADIEHAQKISKALGVSTSVVEEVASGIIAANSLETALGKIGCQRFISENANPFKSDWQPEAINVFYSESNIQRIPCGDLLSTLRGVSELMPPDGVALHQIDCSDIHAQRDFRTVDRELHPLYYLIFDDLQWERMGPREQGSQNRLREFEFYDHFVKAGFAPMAIESYVSRGHADYLRSVPTQRRFLRNGHFEASVRRSRFLMAKSGFADATRHVYLVDGTNDGIPYHTYRATEGILSRRVSIVDARRTSFDPHAGLPEYTED